MRTIERFNYDDCWAEVLHGGLSDAELAARGPLLISERSLEIIQRLAWPSGLLDESAALTTAPTEHAPE
jgi:hypothetical protein